MSGQSTDALIESLSGELEPVRRMAHPFVRIAPWIALGMAYTAGVVYYLGLRPDLANKFEDPVFLFEVGNMLAICMTAAAASAWLCVPDMRGQKWLPAVPLTLLGIFIFWTTIRSLTEGVNMPEPHWDHCFEDAALMGAVPAAVMIFLSRGGATTRPRMMGLMNVLAVAALGYIGLRFTCLVDTVGHGTIYHIVPFVVFGVIFGVLARRVFRW